MMQRDCPDFPSFPNLAGIKCDNRRKKLWPRIKQCICISVALLSWSWVAVYFL